jgi:hypothetical protein
LKSPDSESEDLRDYVIHETHFSLTICGFDDFRWVGYGFADSEEEEEDTGDEDTDDNEEEEEDTGDEDTDDDEEEEEDTGDEDTDDGEEDGDQSRFLEDPIASDGKIDAGRPIENPREYFLRIFEVRSTEVRNEWERVVRELQRSINQCVCWSSPL